MQSRTWFDHSYFLGSTPLVAAEPSLPQTGVSTPAISTQKKNRDRGLSIRLSHCLDGNDDATNNGGPKRELRDGTSTDQSVRLFSGVPGCDARDIEQLRTALRKMRNTDRGRLLVSHHVRQARLSGAKSD